MKRFPCYYAITNEGNEETVYGFLIRENRHYWIKEKPNLRSVLFTKDPRFRAAKRQSIIIWWEEERRRG